MTKGNVTFSCLPERRPQHGDWNGLFKSNAQKELDELRVVPRVGPRVPALFWKCPCGGRRWLLAVVTRRATVEEVFQNLGLGSARSPLATGQ